MTSNNEYRVAIVGATGAVGNEVRKVLEQRNFPVKELVPFASDRSIGKEILFNGKAFSCKKLEEGCFSNIDIAFFDISDELSLKWVPQATEEGAWVIDNSATFRYEKDIPIVVPEVNGESFVSFLKSTDSFSSRQRILTGPNCSTAQMVVALKPILDRWGIKRVVVSTYQSTSGAGAAALDELKNQSLDFINNKPINSEVFPHQIAFNCLPHVGSFKEDGYTGEEQKMLIETRKIFGIDDFKLTATAVRVPTFSCHAESINIECEKSFEVNDILEALRHQEGVMVLDDPSQSIYPLNQTAAGDKVPGAAGQDPVYVGRVRRDVTVESGLNLWVVSDNLRKGAALNAVQVGELLVQNVSNL